MGQHLPVCGRTWDDKGFSPARKRQGLHTIGIAASVARLPSYFLNKYFPSWVIEHTAVKRKKRFFEGGTEKILFELINRISNHPPSLFRARKAVRWRKVALDLQPTPRTGPPPSTSLPSSDVLLFLTAAPDCQSVRGFSLPPCLRSLFLGFLIPTILLSKTSFLTISVWFSDITEWL